MLSTFRSIRFGLLVGIGGGVPTPKVDIRLGDVVVSTPTGEFGGVVQYDFGKAVSGGLFQRTGSLNKPPQILLTAVSRLQSDQMMLEVNRIPQILLQMVERYPNMQSNFACRGQDEDRLFESVPRAPRRRHGPVVHYGLIASGNQVIKDGRTRDKLAQELGILCFEMEAAGLMDNFPCLVVRGICDYADSHKNKQWQGHAAATAAAYTKELLSVIHPHHVLGTQTVVSGINSDPSYSLDFEQNEPLFLVPGRRNDGFVVRQKICDEFESLLDAEKNGSNVRIALFGMGGCGKTELALHFAYAWRGKCRVFWANCTSKQEFMADYSDIAVRVGLASATTAQHHAGTLLKEWLDSTKSGNWRMILDASDNWEEMFAYLEAFLPIHRGTIVFTSRDRRILDILETKLIHPSFAINVNGMDRDEALDMFRSLATECSDKAAIIELLDFLQYLPLAIKHAAGYISFTRTNVNHYLEGLKGNSALTWQLFECGPMPINLDTRLQLPIARTWDMSFAKIREQNTIAADLLGTLSFLNCESIPKDLLLVCGVNIFGLKQMSDFEMAMGVLMAFSLVSHRIDRTREIYQVHSIVSLAANTWFANNDPEKISHIYGIALSLVSEAFMQHSTESFLIQTEDLRHLKTLLPQADAVLKDRSTLALPSDSSFEAKKMRLTYESAKTRLLSGQHVDVEQLMLSCHDYYEEHRYSFPSERTQTMIALGLINKELGSYDRAMQWYKKAINAFSDLPEQSAVTKSVILVNQGNIFREQGDFQAAERAYGEAFSICEKGEPLYKEAKLHIISCQGSMLSAQGEMSQALRKFQDALQGWRTYGEHDQRANFVLADMAAIHAQRGEREAVRKYDEAIDGTIKNLGKEHPRTLLMKADRGRAYALVGEREKALVELENVYKQQLKVLGPAHVKTMSTKHNMGVVLSQLARFDEAQKAFDEVLEFYEKAASDPQLPLGYYYTLKSRADVLREQGDHASALEDYKRSYGARCLCDETSPFLFSIELAKADLFIELGMLEKAERTLADLDRVRKRMDKDLYLIKSFEETVKYLNTARAESKGFAMRINNLWMDFMQRAKRHRRDEE
ncbi:uncharacterized protein CDV56_102722 [Aspergillus thermomutatus]|uniref:Nucleoside phosphorylase domain-containing protein n=1 Tax=Aspergillus thermomutatus TaxID=41047 RepID=A0A397GEQ5_ASPTH|nr:uncharacterized protein CDV56_102722 [Aspergillus thermomutatus]RHZ49492.1 hypothetical protein CDV56_102722 [Aspergillus thermomutatus]